MNDSDVPLLPWITTRSRSPLWSGLVTIGMVLTVILHVQLLRYMVEFLREMVWVPWTVSKQMRTRGYSGPSMSLFKNNKREMKEMTMKAASEPLYTSGKGISHDIMPRVFTPINHWRNLYGEKFFFKQGSKVTMHTSDAEVVKEICNKCYEFGKCSDVSLSLDLLGSRNLLFAERHEWVRQRRVVRPAFYPGRSKKMVVQMATWIELWLQRLDNFVVDNGGSFDIDIFTELFELTKDILARTSFGSSFEKGKEGFKHLENHKNLLIQHGVIPTPLLRWIPTPLQKEINKEKEEVLRCLREIIKDRRDAIRSNGVEAYGDDLLGLLLADRDRRLAANGIPAGDLETEDEHVTDQCRLFFFAGAETVHMFLAWAIVLLSHYSDWQDRIRVEVQEILRGEPPQEEQLLKMKQLKMFVEETLRLYSPAAAVNRQVLNHGTTLLGKPVPKGLVIMINFVALHREKEYWGEDALEFKPERFANGVGQACKKPHAYDPFGWGPRTCVAQGFAITELKLILALLLQRFSFRLSPSYRHEPIIGLTLQPKFGVQVVLERVLPPALDEQFS